MELRGYQREAIDSLWRYIQAHEDNPCIVLPTGAGKTHMLAQIAKDVVGWGGRMLCLTHVRELISQAAGHLEKLAPEITFGVYSAGLKSRDIGYQVTLAGIQSVADKAELFGPIDIILVDEAHRVPQEGDGQYLKFLKAVREINPKVRLIGLTATPYRLSSGPICRLDGMFQEICYEVTVRELIRDGYLSNLKSKSGKEKTDLSQVSIRGGEFVQHELEAVMMEDENKVVYACMEIAERSQDRKSVIVFCTGVEHAKKVASILYELGTVATVFGDTLSEAREATIQAFKNGEIKYLVNVEIATTGLDVPGTDVIAILRPTMSPGLLTQMVGRGMRKAEGKDSCLVLDFGGNFMRHGPIDQIRAPQKGRERKSQGFKECPFCQEVVPYGCDICPDCGKVFPKKSRGSDHDKKAFDGDVISNGLPEEYEVEQVHYWRHIRKGAGPNHPPTMWVEYTCGLAKASEWICFEHEGFARRKAVQWWMARNPGAAIPSTVIEALASIEARGIMEPKKIELKADGKYMRIVRAWEFEFRKIRKLETSFSGQEGEDIPF